MRVTLKDIADRYGVTKAAISLALRNSPRISKRHRDEIQSLAREMGYVSDPFLSALAKYRHEKKVMKAQGKIAWLNHWPSLERLRSYQEFDKYFKAAKKAAKPLGYDVEEFIWPASVPAKSIERMLQQRGILGLLVPPHPLDIDWEDFNWNLFSLIRFGMTVNRPDSNLVTADHQRAVVMAVQKIHDYGYKRIGFVLNEAHDRSMGGNYTGGFKWAQKLLKLNPAIPPINLDLQSASSESSQHTKILDKWVKRYLPDAILTVTTEVPAFLRELGYRIPHDVAVAGTSVYDISVDAGIDQHPAAIGRIAVEMLIKQISLNERGEPDDPCRILVESRWQDGKSLPPRS